MRKGKKLVGVLGTMIVTFGLMMGVTNNIKAQTITTSSHTYTSYALDIHNGQSVLINSSDMVNYYNAHETGFLNTIEKTAWFHRSGGQGGLANAITKTALTNSADITIQENEDSTKYKFVRSISIKGTKPGCIRIAGRFEWINDMSKPEIIHRYPFQACIYNHVNVNGLKVISNAAEARYVLLSVLCL